MKLSFKNKELCGEIAEIFVEIGDEYVVSSNSYGVRYIEFPVAQFNAMMEGYYGKKWRNLLEGK
jgi:hypothetical protein